MAAIAALHARLRHDQAALASLQPGALRDLRVGLRQLRSLLKPLEDLGVLAAPLAAARALAEKTGPVRDREVLLKELGDWEPLLAASLAPALVTARISLAQLPEAGRLDMALQQLNATTTWHDLPSKAAMEQRYEESIRRCRQQLRAAIRQLPPPLAEETPEQILGRHELRLLIKRLRYTLEWQGNTAGPLMPALKAAQARIGEWHDRYVWIAAAGQEASLAPYATIWHSELCYHADAADAALRALRKPLG